MNVNDLVRQRIAAAARRRAFRGRQRRELATARARGLTARRTAKQRRQDSSDPKPPTAA